MFQLLSWKSVFSQPVEMEIFAAPVNNSGIVKVTPAGGAGTIPNIA